MDYAPIETPLSSVASAQHKNRRDYLQHNVMERNIRSDEGLSEEFFADGKIGQ